MIRAFVLVCGATLMSLEMLGSRFLAPQYGNSIVVWASLISVFMTGLAGGYWLGGRLADAWPARRGVAVIVGVAGLLIAAVPLLAEPVFRLVGDSPRSGSILGATLLFLLPSMLLGAVSPYAIRLHVIEQHTAGRVAGQLYALSTVGSIAGTIITAFWLIPLAGIDRLAYSLGAVLLVVALALEVSAAEQRARPLRSLAAVAAGLVVVIGASVLGEVIAPRLARRDAPPWRRSIVERDTIYHRIHLYDERGVRYLKLDRLLQSGMPLADRYGTAVPYTDYFHLPYAINPRAKDILLLGLGGGTTPKQFLRDYPGVRVDVVELDPAIVEIAHQYFALPADNDRLHVYVEDGRHFLARTPRKYDLIFVDVFQHDFIPFHLATREFFALCRDHLNENGLVAMNVVSALGGPASSPGASIHATAGTVFREHYAFAHRYADDAAPSMIRNCIFVFGNGEQMPPAQLFATIEAARGHGVREAYIRCARNFVAGGPSPAHATVLSDRFAPVEELLLRAL